MIVANVLFVNAFVRPHYDKTQTPKRDAFAEALALRILTPQLQSSVPLRQDAAAKSAIHIPMKIAKRGAPEA